MSERESLRFRATDIAGSAAVTELWCTAAQTVIYDLRDALDAVTGRDLAGLSEVRERIERAEAALAHTDVFKADGLVRDARWLLDALTVAE